MPHHTVILPITKNVQDIPYSCGPASLKIILDTLGKKTTEKTLIRLCDPTPEEGTLPKVMTSALRHYKVRYTVHAPGSIPLIEESIRNLNLCLVNYYAWRDGHYSVIFGFTPAYFLLADPANKHAGRTRGGPPIRRMRRDAFERRWYDPAKTGGEKTYRWMATVPLKHA